MPRARYLHCPACDKRKAVEHDFDLPIRELEDVGDRTIRVTRCTLRTCQCVSLGDVVIWRPLRLVNGKREGLVKTPEARKAIARRLRKRARLEQHDALRSLQDAEAILAYVDTLETKDPS